jgi:RecB family exonuclease
MKKPLYLSKSAISDFISCRKRYEYRLHFNKQAQSSVYMTIGIVVHNALEKYWNNHDAAIKYVINQASVWNLEERWLAKMLKDIQSYFKNFREMVSEDDVTEKFFKVKYDDGIFISGKYDRITPDHTIIDWKTGKWEPENLSSDTQMILYYNSYKELYGVYPTAVLATLPTGKLSVYKPNQIYTDTLYNEVIPDMIDAIEQGKFPRDGFYTWGACKNCAFSLLCYRDTGLNLVTDLDDDLTDDDLGIRF